MIIIKLFITREQGEFVKTVKKNVWRRYTEFHTAPCLLINFFSHMKNFQILRTSGNLVIFTSRCF